jgi:hypothetical protein
VETVICENQSGSARLGELLSGRPFEYLLWSGQTLGRGEGTAAFDACPGPQRLRLDAVE